MAVPTKLPQRRIIWRGSDPHKAGGGMRHSIPFLTDHVLPRFRKP
jgi:hypothetical protein